MTPDQVLAVVSIAVTFVIGLITLAFSIWFFIQSKKGEKESSNTLLEVQSAADAVKHEVRNIVAPLFRSVIQRDSEDWKSEMCCSNDDVIQIERAVRQEGKIYVSVVTMNYEVERFLHVIADNIKQHKHYSYFLPTDMPGGYQDEMKRLVDSLKEVPGITPEILKQNLKIYKVESGEILCNVTLLDPGHGKDEGFILPAYDQASRAFSVKLDNTLYYRALGRVNAWIDGKGATVIWPPTN